MLNFQPFASRHEEDRSPNQQNQRKPAKRKRSQQYRLQLQAPYQMYRHQKQQN